MDRLTRPGIEADPNAARFMGGDAKIQDIGDKLLDLILNGPTINGIKKDTLRHMVRQLYAALKLYEDTGGTPQDIRGLQEKYGIILDLNRELNEKGPSPEIADETKMMFANEEENQHDKEIFVSNLGWLLSQTRERVERCYLDKEDQVHVVFRGGSERKVNVKHNSYAAIIRDVTKAL